LKLDQSKLILGTVQMGLDYGINNQSGRQSFEGAIEVLEVAQKGGISYLDTAADYGNSEKIIGYYNQKFSNGNFKIVTKLSGSENVCLVESLEKSFENLQIEKIDILLFHSYDHYLRSKGKLSELRPYLVSGQIGQLGVSVYTNEELLSLKDDANISIVQAPFNLFDNDSLRAETFKLLKSSGKEIHTRSVFLQGLFFMRPEQLPSFLMPLREHMKELHKLCSDNQINISILALAYVLSKDYLDKVLLGVDSANQLRQNLEALNSGIEKDILEHIDGIAVKQLELLNPSLWNK